MDMFGNEYGFLNSLIFGIEEKTLIKFDESEMAALKSKRKLNESEIEALKSKHGLNESEIEALKKHYMLNENLKNQYKIDKDNKEATKTTFIIHGHDELNTLKLEKLLKEKSLNTIILGAEPSRGRTIIEKFEQEAQKAVYAFALFTPDDFVEVGGSNYMQARPNVIFELGWFYGKLGREKVCILFKKGTRIHSDLDGIIRIEFDNSVTEKVLEIEKELHEANLL